MNYSELLDNVRNYTEVTSDVLSNTVINVFLVNIENQIESIGGEIKRPRVYRGPWVKHYSNEDR